MRIRQRTGSRADFDGRACSYGRSQTGQGQAVDLEGERIRKLSEGPDVGRRPNVFVVGHGNRGRVVQRDRPGFTRLRRADQGRGRLAGRTGKAAGGFGQIEGERRSEGDSRAADEYHRGADLRRDDVAAHHRIELPHQPEGDLLRRIQRDRLATDDQGAAHDDLVDAGADGQAPPVIRDRIAAQGDHHGIAGDRRRDAASRRQGYERGESHQGVCRERGTRALGDIQRRTGKEGSEAGRRAGIDGGGECASDLGQLIRRCVDLDGILPAIDGDDPAVAWHWRSGQGESSRRGSAHDRGRGADRENLGGNGKGCRIGHRQAARA